MESCARGELSPDNYMSSSLIRNVHEMDDGITGHGHLKVYYNAHGYSRLKIQD